MNTGLKPVWAGRNMRLDPFRLPQMVSYAARDDVGDITLTIDRRGAIMRRTLQMSGMPVVIALPARAFRGVAARAMEDEDGNVTVTLELLHSDPMLSVPLLVADDLDDIAADWRAWAEAFGLPMLLIEADGVARTLEESPAPPSRRSRRAIVARAASPPRAARASWPAAAPAIWVSGWLSAARRSSPASRDLPVRSMKSRATGFSSFQRLELSRGAPSLTSAASLPPRWRRRSGQGRSASRPGCST